MCCSPKTNQTNKFKTNLFSCFQLFQTSFSEQMFSNIVFNVSFKNIYHAFFLIFVQVCFFSFSKLFPVHLLFLIFYWLCEVLLDFCQCPLACLIFLLSSLAFLRFPGHALTSASNYQRVPTTSTATPRGNQTISENHCPSPQNRRHLN